MNDFDDFMNYGGDVFDIINANNLYDMEQEANSFNSYDNNLDEANSLFDDDWFND